MRSQQSLSFCQPLEIIVSIFHWYMFCNCITNELFFISVSWLLNSTVIMTGILLPANYYLD